MAEHERYVGVPIFSQFFNILRPRDWNQKNVRLMILENSVDGIQSTVSKRVFGILTEGLKSCLWLIDFIQKHF